MKIIEPNDFLNSSDLLVDVRSPMEYNAGHIPGALSLPLFTDAERAQVGTLYKQEGKKTAVKRGLDLVGPKMSKYVDFIEKHSTENVSLYCWRGGMRSQSMGWLFEQVGYNTQLLKGGYKSYRNYLHDKFSEQADLRILTGMTGAGKTLVLNEMAKLNAQVIDLEDLANHQGSSFGNQLTSGQPTTEQFQNQLLHAFLQLDLAKPIWLEDESICIGQVNLPEQLFFQMNKSKHYLLQVDEAARLEVLLSDYGDLPPSRLMAATQDISKKLGVKETTVAHAYIENNQLALAAQIILRYYDRQYQKGLDKKLDLVIGEIRGEGLNHRQIAETILENYGH